MKYHSTMRSYLHGLRERHPPATRAQRELLKNLRDHNQDFARELLKPYGKIDVARLNNLSTDMMRLAVNYLVAKETPETE